MSKWSALVDETGRLRTRMGELKRYAEEVADHAEEIAQENALLALRVDQLERAADRLITSNAQLQETARQKDLHLKYRTAALVRIIASTRQPLR